MAELFAADEKDYPSKFPLSYQEIADRQNEDLEIRQLLRDKPELYKKENFVFGDTTYSLVTKDGRILIPRVLQKKESFGTTNYSCIHALLEAHL
jgi:hypothetical protein